MHQITEEVITEETGADTCWVVVGRLEDGVAWRAGWQEAGCRRRKIAGNKLLASKSGCMKMPFRCLALRHIQTCLPNFRCVWKHVFLEPWQEESPPSPAVPALQAAGPHCCNMPTPVTNTLTQRDHAYNNCYSSFFPSNTRVFNICRVYTKGDSHTLFPHLFNDFVRKKCGYLSVFWLTPHFRNILYHFISPLQPCSWFSITCLVLCVWRYRISDILTQFLLTFQLL